ncbi:hypothetical protein QJS10_CPB21g01817 [Acorus calamus]|uniref:MYND-type domain-containing protein n=1 Tax=Acorus calamus TaxID=4465 RepID=A0AAV9C621_ACOCL|nr:hypothetical protein QJS10_CPB21g01817 [Acorus calamus]
MDVEADDQTLRNQQQQEKEEVEIEGEDEVLDEDDDDDDEDDEEGEPVTLGFVEEPKTPHSLLRHLFPSKAGGTPAWLDPIGLPDEKSRCCGFCENPLQFLLQVYAPIAEKESAFHRTVFVFMCTSMACLLRDQHEQWRRGSERPLRSVKVFRCQLPRLNRFYPSEAPKEDGIGRSLVPGAALCSWCGTWKGEKVCSSCKRAHYCSAKHQVMHWRSGHKADCQQAIISSGSSDHIYNNGRQALERMNTVACKSLWREYEIICEDECPDMVDDDGSSTSLVCKDANVNEVYQSLSKSFEVDDDKKRWASFQERVIRAPEQVLRYCRDTKAKPLWPLSAGQPAKANIPKCSYCNGPLSYEFQIMPQLLYFFNVKNQTDSLDWATIVIYSCSASCEDSSSVSYKEEFPWIQLYSSAMP